MTSVIKLGGSLLHQAHWPDRFRRWLLRQPNDTYLLFVGGGMMIDALRQLDRTHGLSQRQMHWRCIRALDATFEIASELLPEALPIRDRREWQLALMEPRIEKKGLYIGRLGGFYSESAQVEGALSSTPCAELQRINLPEDWSTTSDALAVEIAISLAADRVVLLKACSVPQSIKLSEAAAAGIVDCVTPTLNFPVSIEQLE